MEKGYMSSYHNGKEINYVMGRRLVLYGEPSYRKPRLFLAGPCIASSVHCKDEETIASTLQKSIREYRVEVIGGGFRNLNMALREINFKTGDILLFFSRKEKLKKFDNLKCFNYRKAFQDIHVENHILDSDLFHIDGKIAVSIGKEISTFLYDNYYIIHTNTLHTDCYLYKRNRRNPTIEMLSDDMFKAYISNLKRDILTRTVINNVKGAIVMTCNPFTLGHRFLIEKASKKVDILYVFVVEEDRFQFDFADRISMVRAGTENFHNVIVIPSGKYIISGQTLATYFVKEKRKNAIVDASKDLDMFVFIAQALNISMRFVGEEPIDKVTRQYNFSMKEYLNKYRIDVMEIPRYMKNGNIVSASVFCNP